MLFESMTKSELIDTLSVRGALTKARAEQVVNCVFDTMAVAMRHTDGLEIRGFGTFKARPRSSRRGRNPRTGENVEIPAKMLPRFKAGKELREVVNASRAFAITGGDDGPASDDFDDDD
jgi:integration host factor subunit beta